MSARGLGRDLGAILGELVSEALRTFPSPPRGPLHCSCGPEGHRCSLTATLRRPGDTWRWTRDGWEVTTSGWYPSGRGRW